MFSSQAAQKRSFVDGVWVASCIIAGAPCYGQGREQVVVETTAQLALLLLLLLSSTLNNDTYSNSDCTCLGTTNCCTAAVFARPCAVLPIITGRKMTDLHAFDLCALQALIGMPPAWRGAASDVATREV